MTFRYLTSSISLSYHIRLMLFYEMWLCSKLELKIREKTASEISERVDKTQKHIQSIFLEQGLKFLEQFCSPASLTLEAGTTIRHLVITHTSQTHFETSRSFVIVDTSRRHFSEMRIRNSCH